LSCDFAILSSAFPVNSPWVAKQLTLNAPISFNTFVASLSVPAVSIMSSMMIACFYFTSPTKCMLPISPAPFLCLMIMAREAYFTPTEERRA
jgi:hypothetical protein